MLSETVMDHVGWITDDLAKFESFWVDVLGYVCVQETAMAREMAYELFGTFQSAKIRRYHKAASGPDIEIHMFEEGSAYGSRCDLFNRAGLNHICLHTGEKGTRAKFLEELPAHIERHIYDNPKGWQNIFIRDFEGNWVELRENL